MSGVQKGPAAPSIVLNFLYIVLNIFCTQGSSPFVSKGHSSEVTTHVAEFSVMNLLEEAVRRKGYRGNY